MCLALQHAAVHEIHVDHAAVDRANDAERNRRNRAPGIAEHEHEQHKQYRWREDEYGVEVLKGEPAGNGRDPEIRDAFASDKRVSATLQVRAPPIRSAARSSSLPIESIRGPA